MKNKLLASFLLFALFMLSSCAVQTVILKKDFDFSQIKRVAVIQFNDSTFTKSTGAMVSQLFVKYMLGAGYNVVERDELDALLKEKQLSESSLINPETVRQLKLSGIDAIIAGNVTRYVPEQEFFENGYSRYVAAQVGITCRMIDAGTGEILWAAADTYDAMNTQTAFDYLTAYLVRGLADEIKKSARK